MANYISQIKIGNTLTSLGLAERANQLSYFTCDTAAATETKSLSRENGSTIAANTTYSIGSVIIVRFINGNTAAVPVILLPLSNYPIIGDDLNFASNETVILVRDVEAWRIVNKSESLKWETF